MWYFSMPRSIECRVGTPFVLPCHVRVSCDIKVEIDLYCSPLDRPNTTLLITDSSSNGTHIGAMCDPNATDTVDHLYTLTLERLNYDHVGYYWCQLRVDNSSTKAMGEILPSNQCYVGVGDTVKDCVTGEHYDKWICAQSQSVSTLSDLEEGLLNITPTHTAILNSPLPTVDNEDNSRDNPLNKVSVSIIEGAFLLTIIICTSIIVILMSCLFRKYKKKRESGKEKHAISKTTM